MFLGLLFKNIARAINAEPFHHAIGVNYVNFPLQVVRVLGRVIAPPFMIGNGILQKFIAEPVLVAVIGVPGFHVQRHATDANGRQSIPRN
jgi:hypothetical protein